MTRFLFNRLLSTLPVLLGISIIVFTLARLIPGDPCRAQLGERATDEICAQYNARYGLDQPIYVQFYYWLLGNRSVDTADDTPTNAPAPPNGVLFGDLGNSLQFQRPVTQILAERLPTTIELTLAAMLFAVVLGIPLGVISAYKRNSFIDVMTMIGANIGVSMPVFWLGLMLSFIFGVWVKNFEIGTDNPLSSFLPSHPLAFLALPPSRPPRIAFEDKYYVRWGMVEDRSEVTAGMEFVSRFTILNAVLILDWDNFFEALRHMILPAIAVGTIPLAIIARMTRSSLLEVLNQDYVRTARAKGLKEFRVVVGHALKNALLPVVTIIGLNFGFLISGAVLTETVFSLTGIGKTLFEGITARDYTLVQGVTLVTAIAFVAINVVIDILYSYLDPRVRLE